MLFGYVIDHSSYLRLEDRQDDFDQIKAYALTQVLLAKCFHENLMGKKLLPKDYELI